jgi:hypothetical protein
VEDVPSTFKRKDVLLVDILMLRREFVRRILSSLKLEIKSMYVDD